MEQKHGQGIFIKFEYTQMSGGDLLAVAIYCQMEFLSKDGKVELSVSRIAREIGANRNTVNNRLKKLSDNGSIEFIKKGWKNKSVWRINGFQPMDSNHKGNSQLLKTQSTLVAEDLDNSVAEDLNNRVAEDLDNSYSKSTKNPLKVQSENELHATHDNSSKKGYWNNFAMWVEYEDGSEIEETDLEF